MKLFFHVPRPKLTVSVFGSIGICNRLKTSIMYGFIPINEAERAKKKYKDTSCNGFKTPGRRKSLIPS